MSENRAEMRDSGQVPDPSAFETKQVPAIITASAVRNDMDGISRKTTSESAVPINGETA